MWFGLSAESTPLSLAVVVQRLPGSRTPLPHARSPGSTKGVQRAVQPDRVVRRQL
jgi:hypothetical protein